MDVVGPIPKMRDCSKHPFSARSVLTQRCLQCDREAAARARLQGRRHTEKRQRVARAKLFKAPKVHRLGRERAWRDANPQKVAKYYASARLAKFRERRGGPFYEPPHVGECPCCGRTKMLVWDHDHDTGQFRGWICHKCNLGISQLGDSVAGLERALRYLLDVEEKPVPVIQEAGMAVRPS